MILTIVKYPEPVLEQPGEPVTEFDAELRKFVADMFETTYASQLVLINPEIILSEGRQYEEEGCLSFPEIREKVVRAAKLRIRAQDEHGKWFEMDGEELLARAFQHEIDHLDGIVFLFRMSALKRSLNLRKIRKMQNEGTW